MRNSDPVPYATLQRLLKCAALAVSILVHYIASAPRLAAQSNQAATAVDGLGVAVVEYGQGRRFRLIGAGRWVEENSNGQHFDFAEEKRDRSSITLYDASRDTRLKFDFQNRQILLVQGSRVSLLYNIVRLQASVPPARSEEPLPVPNGLDVMTVIHSNGVFAQQNPKQWVEETSEGARFYFLEENRELTSITLFDKSRDLRVVIDLTQNKLQFRRGGDTSDRTLGTITSMSAKLISLRPLEQVCQAEVQRQIASIRQGGMNWSAENLRQFCSTARVIPAAIECLQNSLKTSSDTQTVIRTCSEKRHQVQVVYAIPYGKEPLPNAEAAIKAAMEVVQRHYFQQLGKTFELKSPLVSIVQVNESAEVIQADMHAHAVRLVRSRFKADYDYRENVILVVFEGTVTHQAHGGNNISSIPGDFWQPVYSAYQKSPASLPEVRILHGWSHELGHAFGLMHTEEGTKPCLMEFGIQMGPLPSLVMQKKETLPDIFAYTFMPEEKRLLLEENYYPPCRPLVARRPHAYWHLHHVLLR